MRAFGEMLLDKVDEAFDFGIIAAASTGFWQHGVKQMGDGHDGQRIWICDL